jgi:hypothetical protein
MDYNSVPKLSNLMFQSMVVQTILYDMIGQPTINYVKTC